MIADHEKEEDEINNLIDDWIFFGLVIDRILLVFFGIVCLLGSFGLFYRNSFTMTIKIHFSRFLHIHLFFELFVKNCSRFMFNLRAENIYEEDFH